MRDRVIELLEFPRRWIPDQMELGACPYSGRYDRSDRVCKRCALKPECAWLFNNSEFPELRGQPLSALLASLDSALWLVDAHRPYGTHTYYCSCDLCTWRRQTEKLLTAKFFSHPPA